MRAIWRDRERAVRYATFAAWLLFIAFLAGLDRPPFSLLAVLAGALLIFAGIAVASDRRATIAALNKRYLGRADGTYPRWFGAAMVTVGICWIFIGVWVTAG